MINQPQDADKAGTWPVAYFTLYLQKLGVPDGDMAEVSRILLAMEMLAWFNPSIAHRHNHSSAAILRTRQSADAQSVPNFSKWLGVAIATREVSHRAGFGATFALMGRDPERALGLADMICAKVIQEPNEPDDDEKPTQGPSPHPGAVSGTYRGKGEVSAVVTRPVPGEYHDLRGRPVSKRQQVQRDSRYWRGSQASLFRECAYPTLAVSASCGDPAHCPRSLMSRKIELVFAALFCAVLHLLAHLRLASRTRLGEPVGWLVCAGGRTDLPPSAVVAEQLRLVPVRVRTLLSADRIRVFP